MTAASTAGGGIVVVVPTRNRPDLAEATVRSVLDQDASSGVSVLVSDNSTDEAHVATLRDVVATLRASHPQVDLRHVQPPEPLPMSPHWEWARHQARAVPGATQLLYLTDRTLLKPGALDLLASIARRHPGRVISFNNEQVNDDQDPVRLERETWSGAVVDLPTRRLLELSAQLIIARPMPRALNSLIPVTTLDEIAAMHGAVFDSTAPDFCFCFRFLESAERMLYVDRPLSVMHSLARSNGNSTTTGVASSDTMDFFAAAEAAGIAPHAPLPAVVTTYNVIVSEYQFDAKRLRPPLNRQAYIDMVARETDAFAAGPMRDGNRAVLAAVGVGFGRGDRWRRQLKQVAHYLRVLGPTDFTVLMWDRLRRTDSLSFPTKESALEAALGDGRSRGSVRHLRYLHGSLVGATNTRVGATGHAWGRRPR